MRRDQLDAIRLSQVSIQAVTVICFVADQSLRESVEETLAEDPFDKLAFVRRSAFDANGERKTVIIGESDDFRSLAAFGGADRETSFFAPVKEASIKASSSCSSQQLLRQHLQDALQFALSHPLLEAAVAGLVRRVFSRQLTPLRPCTQDPQDSVENRSRVLPRTTSTIGASLRSQDRFNQLSLGIVEFPSSSHGSFLTAFLRPENSTVGSTTIYETSSSHNAKTQVTGIDRCFTLKTDHFRVRNPLESNFPPLPVVARPD
jgi:hypothetical protein